MLNDSVREGKYVILSRFVEGDGEDYYKAAVKSGVEGVMAKKKDSIYTPGRRSDNWLKIKKLQTCDCVIFGYTKGEGVRQGTFGALVLGLYEGKKPVYVGKVGTGFSEKDIDALKKSFKHLEVKERTLQEVNITEDITWLKAELVCEVIYQAITKDGKLRMPRFRGIRLDKTAANCTIDQIRPKKLEEYFFKRHFNSTSEPRSISIEVKKGVPRDEMVYVVQEHHARRLHYDLRLEKDGVLKSWAIPKGLPEVLGDKRLAIQVEDHPLEYRTFEGEIPKGEYGAGIVKIWDKGSYEPFIWNDDMIEIVLKGNRIKGRYVLTRFKKAGKNQWLILKTREKNG
jgi:bifunctional non-homologous end joining protein LigD